MRRCRFVIGENEPHDTSTKGDLEGSSSLRLSLWSGNLYEEKSPSERPFGSESGKWLMPFCLGRFDEGASMASTGEEGVICEKEWPLLSMPDRNGRPECIYTSAGEALIIGGCTK